MFRYVPFLLLLLVLPVRADELTILVDTGTEMPMARFKGWELAGGINYDVGQALAKTMGRTARFLVLPRQRMVNALEQGNADVVCAYTPQWLKGNFGWSQPFLPTIEVLLTNRTAPRPSKLEDVSGQAIGTVLGFKHPELEEALGKGFVRDDGPNMEASLRKLSIGRIRHAMTTEYIYAYRIKQGDPPLTLHPPLVVKRHMTQCAVSPKGRVTVAEVDAGIAQMLKEDTLPKIVAKYR